MENESDDGLLFYRFSTTLCNVIENAAFLRLSVYMSTVRTVSIMGFTFLSSQYIFEMRNA